MEEPGISYEYIRGVVAGEGCFSFSPTNRKIVLSDGSVVKEQSPGFYLAMDERDKALIEAVRDSLNLPNKVHRRNSQSYHLGSGATSVLAVRSFDSLKLIIIPLFYGKLRGYKAYQFYMWLESMGDEDKSEPAYLLYVLYKTGFFDKSIDEFL